MFIKFLCVLYGLLPCVVLYLLLDPAGMWGFLIGMFWTISLWICEDGRKRKEPGRKSSRTQWQKARGSGFYWLENN